MPNILETETITRSLLPIIYVLDTSGSMKGSRIDQLNKAMEKTTDIMAEVAENNSSAEIKLGILTFSSDAEWMYDQLIYPGDFYWTDLQAEGVTDVGAALRKLDEKLSRNEWLNNGGGNKQPVLIFMSDGKPTDDYISALNKIESENKWFQVALKIAIAIGDDADRNVLARICGNPNAVIGVDNIESLVKLIQVVSVTASQIGSQSKVAGMSSVENILQGVKMEMEEFGGVEIVPDYDPVDPWSEVPEEVSTNDSDWDFDMNEGW